MMRRDLKLLHCSGVGSSAADQTVTTRLMGPPDEKFEMGRLGGGASDGDGL